MQKLKVHITGMVTGVLALVVLCSGCTAGRQATAEPTVCVSIGPLKYLVEQLAGDMYHVETMTPAGVSPETYQPTPAQIAALDDCLAYVRVGTLGFEKTTLRRITENVPHLYQINASATVRPLEGADGDDPHAWTSPGTLKLMAGEIARGLAHIDKHKADTIKIGLAAFQAEMDSLDRQLSRQLEGIESHTFLIYHPALGYFAQAYGLKQLAVEQDGKKPSAAHLAGLVRQCREEGVKVVFVEKEYDPALVAPIAREIGAKVVVIDPLSDNPKQQFIDIAKALCP
ncbi:MAG: metal ABC transporter solute-binding protein, Zn/Mn family [Alloprevotella sp.]